MTVALDAAGAEAAGPWIDRARPTHPSLIDAGHVLDELLGIVNVPMGLWIDEHGLIVRPPEPAFPWRPREPTDELLAQLPPLLVEQMKEAQNIRIEPEPYLAALRDWVARGADSPYALGPEEVLRRSRPRSAERSRAAASFELGQYLHRQGHPDDAVAWFREAHRLHPENWTYKRQAWSLADPLQGPTDAYDSDFLTEIRAIGAENFYAPVQLEDPPAPR